MTWVAGQKVRASAMPGYVCTSGTRPSGHSGQIIYETDTGMTAIYTGSAWRYLVPTGEIASDAQYQAASDQTISSGSDTLAAFGTTKLSSTLVTRNTSGAGHAFRLNRAGRWAINTTVRWENSASGGERFNSIMYAGSNVASQGILKAASSSPITFNLSVLVRVTTAAAGTSSADVAINAYQFAGSNQVLEADDGSAWGRINLSWLGP